MGHATRNKSLQQRVQTLLQGVATFVVHGEGDRKWSARFGGDVFGGCVHDAWLDCGYDELGVEFTQGTFVATTTTILLCIVLNVSTAALLLPPVNPSYIEIRAPRNASCAISTHIAAPSSLSRELCLVFPTINIRGLQTADEKIQAMAQVSPVHYSHHLPVVILLSFCRKQPNPLPLATPSSYDATTSSQ